MKTEKQKMLAGELYTANDPELVADHLRAQRLLTQFNDTAADEDSLRRGLLEELFGSFGEDSVIKPTLRCDYGYNISVGDRSFVNYDCVFLDCNTITVGTEVQIGPGVHIYTATHPLDARLRRQYLESALPITIADGVWLGGGAIICPGIYIGANTVVGAGSVVTRDLPSGVFAAGNPCRVIREI